MKQGEYNNYIEAELLKFQNFNVFLDIIEFHEKLKYIAERDQLILEKSYEEGINGYILFKKGRLVEAIEVYLKALNMAKEEGKKVYSADLEERLAAIFRELGRTELSLRYLTSAEEKKDVLPDYLKGRIYNEIGGNYLSKGNLDKAMEYYEKAQYYAERIEDIPLKHIMSVNIGYIVAVKKGRDLGLNMIKKALEYFKREKLSRIVGSIYEVIGEINKQYGNIGDSIQWYEKAQWIFYKEKSMAYYLRCKTYSLGLKLENDRLSSNMEREFEESIMIGLEYKLEKILIEVRKLYVDYLLRRKKTDEVEEQELIIKEEEKLVYEREQKLEGQLEFLDRI